MAYQLEIFEIREQNSYSINDCKVSRAFEDEVCVTLECGYKQRFWLTHWTDEQLINQCRLMKSEGIKSSKDFF